MSAVTTTMDISSPAPSKEAKRRVNAIDIMRGVAITLLVFMDHPAFIKALPWWLVHPAWNGFRLADFVFPCFLFISGVSLVFQVRKAEGDFKAATLSFLKRTALLILIGLALNLLKYGLPLRYMGVLQRIALGGLLAWPFIKKKPWVCVVAGCTFLLSHALLLLFVHVPSVPAASFASPDVSLQGWLDTKLFGIAHTYFQTGFDPEGLLGTLSAAGQTLLGLALGKVILSRPDTKKAAGIFGIGVLGLLLGYALWPIIPVNKQLWTPTFVLVSSGYVTCLTMFLYYIADIRGVMKPFRWLIPMGRQTLLIYIGSMVLFVVAGYKPYIPHFLGIGEMPPLTMFGTWLARTTGVMGASLFISAAEVVFWWLVSSVLDKKKIYLRL